MSMCAVRRAAALLACAVLVGCSLAPAAPATPIAPATAGPGPATPAPAATSQPTAAASSPTPADASPTPPPQPDTVEHLVIGSLVYQRGDGSLWHTDGPGSQPVSLTEPTEPEALLPWAASPDGRTIAVVAGTGLWYQFHDTPALALWLVGADGASRREVTSLLPPRGVDPTPGGDDAFNLVPALTSQQRLAWSPDGRLLAFVSAHEGQVDLYTAALDGAVARVTSTPRLEQGPQWSPDGALLGYRTTSGFGSGAGWGDVAVEVAPRGGGDPIFVMGDRALAAGSQAAAIPDLFWIGPDTLVAGLWDTTVGKAEVRALSVSRRAATAIFAAPYAALAWNEATQQLAIAGTPASVIQLAPQGRALAPGLFAWSPDAAEPARIESEPVEALAWAPQGDALAYAIAGERARLRLWSIGTDGDLRTLADQAAATLRWSPDGRRLAADGAIYDRGGGMLADLRGASADPIGWAPQGLFYFTAGEGSEHDLWLWDGSAAHKVDTKIRTTENSRIVLSS